MQKRLSDPVSRTDFELLALEQRVLLAADVIFSEIMTANDSGLTDFSGERVDWIELQNRGDTAADLSGWYLTDDYDAALTAPDLASAWEFPLGTSLDPGQYMIIFASGKADEATGSEIHASFKLSSAGEYLGLVTNDGLTVADEFVPTYPRQYVDISYGRLSGTDEFRYFDSPSPGSANTGGVIDFVEDVVFNVERGFYDTAFDLHLATPTTGATIYYTLDGTEPTTSSYTYNQPIHVDGTTFVRAFAVKSGWVSSYVDTHSYIFLDDVINQGDDQSALGFPDEWINNTGNSTPGSSNQRLVRDADYEMDPDIDIEVSDLLTIPSVSLVVDVDDYFDPNTGMYVNSMMYAASNIFWEKAVSMEYMDPNTGEQFQINAGSRILGELARWPVVNKKQSIRILFKDEYGASKLNYPVFEDSEVESFDTLVLRANWGDSYLQDPNLLDYYPDYTATFLEGNPTDSLYMRDTHGHDVYGATGNLAPHSEYAHLYINGLYWGLYQILERPDDSFNAEYQGGDKDVDWDVFKGSLSYTSQNGELVAGNRTLWNELFSYFNFNPGLDSLSNEDYLAASEYLDMESFADYFLSLWYIGRFDFPRKNWYAAGRKAPAGSEDPMIEKFRFYTWDSEASLGSVTTSTEGRYIPGYGSSNDTGPVRLFQRLITNDEFRMLFADRMQLHCFNGGALTPEASAERFQARVDEISVAMIGESARWGDSQFTYEDNPLTVDDHWWVEVNDLLTEFFPQRTSVINDQLRNAGLYPMVDAPVYNQHGGNIDYGFGLEMTAPNGGTIYYTTDGTDPRVSNSEAPQILRTVTLVQESAAKRVLIPSVANGGDLLEANDWTGLNGPFDDSSWISGNGGVGYEDGSGDYYNYFDIDVKSEMNDINETAYIRIPFNINANDLDGLNFISLRIRYDDGFAAYINGQPVAWANEPSRLEWNSGAEAGHSDDAAKQLVEFKLNADIIDSLGETGNVLAIHGLNSGIGSSDFLISAELIAGEKEVFENPTGVAPTAFEYDGAVSLDMSANVMARVLDDGEWSALVSADFFIDDLPQLVVTEINYHPVEGSDYEFIEVMNAGSTPLNLLGVRFDADVEGIEFAFPNMVLQPNEYAVVVKDRDTFETKYGPDVNVAGEYDKRLSNAGETITLRDARGEIIQQFAFSDQWQPTTDGGGYTLTVVNPHADPVNWDQATNWRASNELDGSPGYTDVPVIPGDANRDGQVGLLDLDALGRNYGVTSGATWEMGDFNASGSVTLLDLDILGAHWGQSAMTLPAASGSAAALLFDQPGAAANDVTWQTLDPMLEDEDQPIVRLF